MRARVWVGAVGAAGLLVGTGLGPLAGAQQASSTTGTVMPGALPLDLKVRRVRDGVEVVIENAGSAPQLEQTSQGTSWLGRLTTAQPAVLLRGPQAVALPEAGVRSISIEGSDTVFTLRATPVGGTPMRPPLVSADGRNLVLSFAAPLQATLQTTQRNSLAPGAVANPNLVPPLRARATAPPVGDMAVGTMVLKDPSASNQLDLGGPPVTLTFRNVPALTALQALARIGGYGFISNSKNSSLETTDTVRGNTAGGLVEKETSTKETKVASPPVSASFVREDYGTAFNLILTSAGLQARLTPNGRTIIVGQNACGFGGGNIASKVYRLNQASPESAAHYLASLGSFIRIPRTFQTTQSVGTATNVGGGSTSGGETSSSSTSTITRGTEIEAFGGQVGPLQGLCGTIDKRLGTITLVGQMSLVAVGEQYLRQIDLRQRQVALSIRVLDVSLGNDNRVENSFAFRYGNNFIVNDRGRLVGAFGNLLPPSADPANTAFNRGFPDFELEFDPSTGSATASDLPTGYNALGGVGRVPPLTPSPDVAVFKDVTRRNPGVSYPRNNFFDFVTATIQSSNTKVLASPTLILSENSDEDDAASSGGQVSGLSANFLGNISTNNFVPSVGRSRNNESAVVVGEQVVTSFNVQAGQNGAPNTCQPVLGIAGLTFGAKVLKIDDNGFVTFKLSPAISAGIRRELVSGCGFIDILAIRSLDTGSSRVRDGQTLILTGVISDRDIQEVTKWPILGDMPFIGQFFRNTAGNRQKRELVVMVSPRIINDTEGGSYGYGFEPSSNDSRRLMNSSPSSAMPGFMTQP